MPPFIFVKAFSKEFRQGFSEGCCVNGPIVLVVCNDRQVNIGVWPLFIEGKTVASLETLAIVAINGWNRLNISFRTLPGSYQPRRE